MAPDGEAVYACDIAHRAVFRYRPGTGTLERFATGAAGVEFRNPNAIAFTADGGGLYVSDSYPAGEPGPSVFRFTTDGAGQVWCPEPSAFANGLALAPDGSALYIAESFLPAVSRVAIDPVTGAAGSRELVVELPGTVRTAWPSARTGCSMSAAMNRARSCGCGPMERWSRWRPTRPPTCCAIRPTSPSVPTGC